MKKHKFKEYWLKEVIFDYFDNECYYCGETEELHIHHKLPKFLGGKNKMNNIELVCPECHNDIHKQWLKIRPRKQNKITNLDRYMKMLIEQNRSENE